MVRRLLLLPLLLVVGRLPSPVAAQAPAAAERRTYQVAGVTRTALVRAVPGGKAPLVLFFHGHGGTAFHAARAYRVHQHWPQATLVYLQGLTGVPGITDPRGEKTGWQKSPGDQGDRDLAFVDAVLADLKVQPGFDPDRVYAMGHSNGSAFVSLLWAARGEHFAALCMSSAQMIRNFRQSKPKSVFQLAGEKDPIVPFAGQKLGIEYVHSLLKCRPGVEDRKGFTLLEECDTGFRHGTYVHPGGHEWPQESFPVIVDFLKAQVRKS